MNKTTYESVFIEQQDYARVLHFRPDMIVAQEMIYNPNYDYFVPPHWHRSLEFTFVKKGKLKLRVNGESKVIESGEYIIINSGELHEIQSLDNNEFDVICIIISYEILKEMIPDFYSYYFRLDSNKKSYLEFSSKFEKVLQTNEGEHKFKNIKVNGFILDILYDLIEEHSIRKDQNVMRNQEFTIGAIDYVHAHYNEPLSLEMISDAFGMSREHFARVFKQSVGSTFLEYLTDYRIYQAFPEIVKSELTIETISRKHGFPNAKALITQFDKRYGQTPVQFRKNKNVSIIDHNDNNKQQQ